MIFNYPEHPTSDLIGCFVHIGIIPKVASRVLVVSLIPETQS